MRYLIVTAIILIYALWCWLCWWRYNRRHVQTTVLAEGQWIVAFASQTGTAEIIAEQTQQQLQAAGIAAVVLPLNRLQPQQLQQAAKVLLIVSTYGEGEAPDNGARFLHRLDSSALSHLEYAVLALGDSNYAQFCAFGHAVNHALKERSALALFDMVEVDREDVSSLHHWQYCLGKLTGHSWFSDWQTSDYQSWTLQKRQWVNQGSPGAPVYHLSLLPAQGQLADTPWQAGDIAEIGPCNSTARMDQFLQQAGIAADEDWYRVLNRKQLMLDTESLAALPVQDKQAVSAQLADLPHREYSIASIPASGSLELLVRQVQCGEDDWGLGSGWLTHFAQTGSEILLKIRSNSRFHTPQKPVPMILIGNGTGIAGLRSHLQQRIADGVYSNWLFFGERSAQHDFFFGEEIRQWQDQQKLQKLDVVFSRELGATQSHRYVQDLLLPVADEIRQWINEGAVIYVCGSLQGMAQGVDQMLTTILGEQLLLQLADEGRYCRDVY